MSTTLFLSIELSQLETDYRNLDGNTADIVSSEWKENELEIWYNGELMKNEVDIDETEIYITHDGKWKMTTCLYIESEIGNIEEFVDGLTVKDFMINSHMENKMIDASVVGCKMI